MTVEKLITTNFRNLHNSTINFHSDMNFFIGDNGSGKSSILEALFFIGHGKSFRTSKLDSLARYEESKFVVSVKDNNDSQLGLSRDVNTGITNIKIDGEHQTRLSVLARNIAIQIVTPESFKLFFGGPKERRRFVDLGMFHVEHDFSKQWKNFSRVLKQRNACIRLSNSSIESASLLSYWTEQFCVFSEEVSKVREEYSLSLIDELELWLSILLPDLKSRVRVQYLKGWPQKKNLIDVLTANQDREVQFGYSLYGAHKFDLKFLLDNKPLETQLSRGQQKLFLLALTFAQAKLIERVNRVKPILLIDDIGAELDFKSRSALSNAIQELNCQVVITAIEPDALKPFVNAFSLNESDLKTNELDTSSLSLVNNTEYFSMFHVKHGKTSEIYPDNSELIIRKSN